MHILKRIGMLTTVAALTAAGQAATAQAEFGVSARNYTVDLSGPTARQAGSAADFRVAFKLNTEDPDDPSSPPDGTAQNIDTELPYGLIGNPTNIPPCAIGQIGAFGGTDPCPVERAVGISKFHVYNPSSHAPLPLTFYAAIFRVETEGDEAAAFAFGALGRIFRIKITVDPSNGYRVRARLVNTAEDLPLIDADVTFWGVPQEHTGLATAGDPGSYTLSFPAFDTIGVPQPANVPRTRFMSTPTRCDRPTLDAVLRLTSWNTKQTTSPLVKEIPEVLACNRLPFAPSIEVAPDSRSAGQPSGYQVNLNVPQINTPDGVQTANLKDAVVKLPAGLAISPPQADGLQACSDAQLDLNGAGRETCPDASKIGTVSIDTPVLDEPVKGSIYIGTQQSSDPESGQMYRIFLTATAPGVRLKLRGQIRADSKTGQLTATFLDNPELPFSKFSLHLKAGDRAALVNPVACGTTKTTTSLTSWGGQALAPSDDLAIDQGCPTGQFAPSFSAGTTEPVAGGYSPFTMTVGRADADQALSSLKLELPAGLLGALSSVPLCGEAQAAAGTCDAASRIGSTTVSVGSGGAPFTLGGTVSLAGPYKGEPFSLSVAVPAKAGPFDLGLVVVRAALHVDPSTAKVSAISDPFPTIVGGVPVRLRMVNVALDRTAFTFNPTSCTAQQVTGQLVADTGATADRSTPFAVKGCGALPFAPSLAMGLSGSGQTTDGKHPGLSARLTMGAGQANNRKATVTLPLSLALDPDNANGLCEPADALADTCPAASIVGSVKAVSPILDGELTGPVYFVRGERIDAKTKRVVKTLPKLFVPMTASAYPGLKINLNAASEVVDDRLVTTFDNIPDAPISSFDLNIAGGQHGILVVSNTDVCAATQVADARFTAQSGKPATSKVTLSTPCALRVVKSSHTAKALKVTIGGIGAGKVSVSGQGLRPAGRKIGSATTATVVVPLSKANRAALAKHRDVKVTLSVRYVPTGKKAITTTKHLTIHGAKPKAKPKR